MSEAERPWYWKHVELQCFYAGAYLIAAVALGALADWILGAVAGVFACLHAALGMYMLVDGRGLERKFAAQMASLIAQTQAPAHRHTEGQA